MWGLKKKGLQAKSETVKYVYHRFSVCPSEKTDTLSAAESRNCDCRGGKLTTGIGMEYYAKGDRTFALLQPNMPTRLYCVQKKLVKDESGLERYKTAISYMTKQGDVRMYDDTNAEFASVGVCDPATAVTSFLCFDKISITAWANKNGVRCLSVGEAFSDTDLSVAKGVICSFHHRLFAAKDPYTVVYSDPVDPRVFHESLDGSGEITFPSTFGEIVGLQPIGERLYIFFEHAIFRLEAKGAATEFKTARLYYDGGKIFMGSIGACGDGIFFLTDHGARRFDGRTEKSERIGSGLDLQPLDNGQICYHATHGNTFFLRFEDGGKGMRTVAFDSAGESGYDTFDVDGLSESESIAFGTWNGAVGVLSEKGALPDGETYRFATGALRFGSVKPKTLKRLRFFGKGSFLLQVVCGDRTVEKSVEIENGDTTVELKEKAECFFLRLELQKGTEITGLIAEIERLT